MTGYLLDTNIPLYLEDPSSPFYHSVLKSFQRLQDDDQLYISVLSLYELYYGMFLRKRDGREELANQTLLVIEEIKNQFTILPLSGKEAAVFGQLKARYKARLKRKEDQPENIKKNDFDFILAATAMENDLTVVSNDGIFNNIKELFPNLRVENWAAAQ